MVAVQVGEDDRPAVGGVDPEAAEACGRLGAAPHRDAQAKALEGLLARRAAPEVARGLVDRFPRVDQHRVGRVRTRRQVTGIRIDHRPEDMIAGERSGHGPSHS